MNKTHFTLIFSPESLFKVHSAVVKRHVLSVFMSKISSIQPLIIRIIFSTTTALYFLFTFSTLIFGIDLHFVSLLYRP